MIRSIAITLALLLAALPSVAGEIEPGMLRPGIVEYPDGSERELLPDYLPFGAGEVLDYDILYGALRVGKARMETHSSPQDDGRPALKILSRAKSEGWVDAVYKVRDQIESIMDLNHLHSLRMSKQLREGKYKHDSEAIFNHGKGLVRYSDGTDKEMIPGSQDVLTALFYVRTFPLDVGMTLHIPIHDGKKGYLLRVNVKGRETIKTKMGKIECLVLEPKMKSRGLFKSEGQMLVYLSDDARRLPVLLKAKAPVGSFTSQLSSYKQGTALEGLAWQVR